MASALPASATPNENLPAYEPVRFNFDSSGIGDYAKEQLLPMIEFLSENRDQKILLTGHTDSVGSEQYNKILSVSRAEAIKEAALNPKTFSKNFSCNKV
jgi:outer membrane protein OmpA-like peptidoglycan-associated protein